MYRDGGVPIKYSAYVVSAVGEYIPSTDGLHITMGYEVETVDIPLSIIWDDDNDRDGQRPVAVVVTLTIDGEPTAYQSMATEENGWTVLFEGFAAYAQSDKGHKINYGVVVTEPKAIPPPMPLYMPADLCTGDNQCNADPLLERQQ